MGDPRLFEAIGRVTAADIGVPDRFYMFRLWRSAPPAQKLQKVLNLGKMVNELVRGELRQRYPGATQREIDLRLVSRNLPGETMIRAFGWDPEIHGY